MQEIFQYTDYRKWFQDKFNDLKEKKPIISWRYIGQKLEIDPGNLLRIAQGKIHLSIKHVPLLSDFFGLQGRERKYFEEMVYFGRARTDKETLDHYEKMQMIRSVDLKYLEEDELEFYQHWYHNTIRSLISINSIRDEYALLGRMCQPELDAKTVHNSVLLMEKLGLLQRNAQGIWEVADQFVSSGYKWKNQAVREFQLQTLDLAKEALERHAPPYRDISTVTFPINKKDISAIKERIRNFRAELLRFSKDTQDDNAIMQLNIQLFPTGYKHEE
jgi:uncharacterized protein (TIGR02147 family)